MVDGSDGWELMDRTLLVRSINHQPSTLNPQPALLVPFRRAEARPDAAPAAFAARRAPVAVAGRDVAAAAAAPTVATAPAAALAEAAARGRRGADVSRLRLVLAVDQRLAREVHPPLRVDLDHLHVHLVADAHHVVRAADPVVRELVGR